MTNKRFKAAVVGGSGYGGGELVRRLLVHPEVELVRVASVDFVGEPLWAAHPNLEGRTDLVFEGLAPADAARGVDVVLLGLPHKVSAQRAPEIMREGARVVDLSGDFRLRDPAAYARYYGAPHPCPDELTRGTFVYGLPELNRDAIRRARYVASPGCFATTVELALLPLARRGLLAGPIEVVGITGSSGSGVAPSAGTHHPVRASNLRTYKPLDHQHVPEIAQALSDAGARDVTLRFVPVSAPLPRGIFATCFAHVDAAVDPASIAALWGEAYAGEPFVRVPAKRLPEVAAVKGTNVAEAGVVVGDARDGKRLVTCFAATDNLIKGGAGQAIQSMNLMLGLDERLTLDDSGGLAVSSYVVVKLGGEVVASPHMAAIAGDVARMAARGERVVVVHGGGPQVTEMQRRLGQEPAIIAGRRVTDAAALQVVKMVVAGQVNVDACAALVAAGGRPVGLHGASSLVLRAARRPPRVLHGAGPEPVDLGYVGDVIEVRRDLVALLCDGGYVPVIACLGADEHGHVLNINADVVANQVAIALAARALVLVSDVPGVLRDVSDPASRVARLDAAEGRRAILDGVVTRGMIPKLEESFAAIAAGVRAVHVVGRLGPGDLAREIESPGAVGTVLVA